MTDNSWYKEYLNMLKAARKGKAMSAKSTQQEFTATSEGKVPDPTPVAFEARVGRDKTGAVTIYMKSPMLEDVMSAMTGGATSARDQQMGALSLHDSVTGAPGSFNRRAKVYYNDSIRFAGETSGLAFADQPFYSGKPSILVLAAVGLRSGITWRIEQPMTVDQLTKYADALKKGVKAIFDSVRPVDITFKLPLKRPASAPSAALPAGTIAG